MDCIFMGASHDLSCYSRNGCLVDFSRLPLESLSPVGNVGHVRWWSLSRVMPCPSHVPIVSLAQAPDPANAARPVRSGRHARINLEPGVDRGLGRRALLRFKDRLDGLLADQEAVGPDR